MDLANINSINNLTDPNLKIKNDCFTKYIIDFNLSKPVKII